MKQFLKLISLSEEGPDRGQEGKAGRQGAGVRGEVKRRVSKLVLVLVRLHSAHLGRDGPGLLLQPIITSLASPFLAKSLLHVGQGRAKKTQVSDFQNGKAVSHP